MFFQEKVENGKLYYRTSPRGEWIPYTIEGLRNRAIELLNEANNAHSENWIDSWFTSNKHIINSILNGK